MSPSTPDEKYAATVARHRRDGRGRGIGIAYLPWITVRTKGLNSNTWRPCGRNGRTYHLLSNVEMAIFTLLDRSPRVTDIREQFPLLPLSETRKIAEEVGSKHPQACPFKDRQLGNVDIVMTTDFLVDVRDEGDLPAAVAISVKPAAHLDDNTPVKLKNLLSKAEIERRYWEARKVPFLMVTEADAPSSVLSNLDLLHRFVDLKGTELPASVEELADHLFDLIAMAPDLPIKEHARNFDGKMSLKRGTGLVLAWHCIASGLWSVDITVPLAPASPLPPITKAGAEA